MTTPFVFACNLALILPLFVGTKSAPFFGSGTMGVENTNSLDIAIMSYKLLVKNAKQLVMITRNHEKMLCGSAMNDIVVLDNASSLLTVHHN